MIYFNCTSVFHSFIISYIMTKEFSKTEKMACLIVPGHVKNLVDLAPNLRKLPFIDKVVVVEECCKDLNADDMLKEISFDHSDLIFIGGMERIGIWLMNQGEKHGLRVIFFEEGANIFTGLDQYLELVNTFGAIKEGELARENIHEVWKLNGTIKMNDTENSIRVHDLEMCKYLHDKQFADRFLQCMDVLFSQEKKVNLAPIIFFDTYALAASKRCNRSIEKKILEKIMDALSEWEFKIKPHPNDFTEWKYEENYPVMQNTNVPVEVLRIKQLDADLQDQIYIAYGMTGCITNELFLLGGSPYVIFLYKIVRLYGIEYPGELMIEHLYETCSEEQRKKIYVPDSFSQMKMILCQITGKVTLMEEDDFLKQRKKEMDETGREVRNIYRSMFWNLADELNETSVMCMDLHKNWNIVASKKILANKQKYYIEFDLPTSSLEELSIDGCAKQTFRWYIARGAIVKVRLHHIVCFDQENHAVHEILPEDMVWLDAKKEENNWYIFDNCDPQVEFQVEQKDWQIVCKIVIDTEIEWDLSYEAILLLRNKNLESMASSLEQLDHDNRMREETIRQLTAQLKDWENEVRSRDEEIKQTIQQRDELNAILVKERMQWQQAILEERNKTKVRAGKKRKNQKI